MATEAKSIDMTMSLETELRHKLFDELIEDYLNGEYKNRLNKIPIDTLNKSEFLFGCKGRIDIAGTGTCFSTCWFLYFIDKVVILWFITDPSSRGCGCPETQIIDYKKVIKYGSTLNCISIYDVSKI